MNNSKYYYCGKEITVQIGSPQRRRNHKRGVVLYAQMNVVELPRPWEYADIHVMFYSGIGLQYTANNSRCHQSEMLIFFSSSPLSLPASSLFLLPRYSPPFKRFIKNTCVRAKKLFTSKTYYTTSRASSAREKIHFVNSTTGNSSDAARRVMKINIICGRAS